MLIICEDCGKKYRLDTEILGPKPVKFKCKACTHLIMLPGYHRQGGGPGGGVQAPLAVPPAEIWNESEPSQPRGSIDGSENQVEAIEYRQVGSGANDTATAGAVKPTHADSDAIPAMLSLRSKMLLLFFVLPVILFSASSVLFLRQTVRLEQSLTEDGAAIIARVAEENITDPEVLSQPVTAFKSRSQSLARQVKTASTTILGGTLLIIGVILSIFTHRLTTRVRLLTDAAERISIGELETEIPVCSGDEFGKLAEAISRMQDSIRLSIERLRRR